MPAQSRQFPHSQDQLKEIASDILKYARELGATDAATEISEGDGLSVSVRRDEIETIEHNRDKTVGVSVFIGNKRGNASTSDFSLKAIRDTVAAAHNIARFTAEDDCAGLAEADLLERNPPDLDLYHPWELTADVAVDLARRAERASFETDSHIANSDGASVSAQHSQFVLATSRGFIGGYPVSRHYISCSAIASLDGQMQRDDWHTSQRDSTRLLAPEKIGRYAAQRALSRLGARPIDTCKVPVLFEAPIAMGLINSLVQATSGGALYRKATFLADSIDHPVLADHLSISEDPYVKQAMGSAPFDDEGVRTAKRLLVDKGTLRGYFLSTYSARKLGVKTTGNAGGAHNLTLTSSLTQPGDDLDEMIRKMGKGLLVTDLMGQGVNIITGDYSRGASGFWVENGQIQFPVEEITIAGNLADMLRHIVAVGSDTLVRGNKTCGSILVERMTVAGRASGGSDE